MKLHVPEEINGYVIERITPEEMLAVVNDFVDNGKNPDHNYVSRHKDGMYVAAESETGECYVEEFRQLKDAIAWIINDTYIFEKRLGAVIRDQRAQRKGGKI